MGLEPQEQTDLYNNYWYRMEESFGRNEYSNYFLDCFMRDYLTIKNNGRIPRIDEVYKEFKIYVRGHINDAKKRRRYLPIFQVFYPSGLRGKSKKMRKFKAILKNITH